MIAVIVILLIVLYCVVVVVVVVVVVCGGLKFCNIWLGACVLVDAIRKYE